MKRPLLILAICMAIFAALGVSAADASDFSLFEIREIAVKGSKLHIRGDADLPEGAMLNIALHFPGFDGKPGNKKDIKVHVNKNHFFIQVRLPKDRKDCPWIGILRAIFRQSLQEEKIKKQVGPKGEHLKGIKVRFENGENIFFDERDFSLEL